MFINEIILAIKSLLNEYCFIIYKFIQYERYGRERRLANWMRVALESTGRRKQNANE